MEKTFLSGSAYTFTYYHDLLCALCSYEMLRNLFNKSITIIKVNLIKNTVRQLYQLLKTRLFDK